MNTAQTPNDVELIREAMGGSLTAFELLVRTHQRGVRLAISKWISCPSTIDDLAQEVFLAAFERLRTFNTEAVFSAWLYGIARNKIKEHLRREYRRHEQEKQLLESRLHQWKLQEIDNELTDDDEQHTRLMHCLGELAPESKRLVEQHYFEGTTLEALASKAKRTSGSLRMVLLRIRKTLAKCIRISSR